MVKLSAYCADGRHHLCRADRDPCECSCHAVEGNGGKILDFIRRYHADHGFPPSVREIGEAVGLSSTSTVHFHLTNLQRQGKITHHPKWPRTITLTEDEAAS